MMTSFFNSPPKIFRSNYPKRKVPSDVKWNLFLSNPGIWFGMMFFLVGLIPSVLLLSEINWTANHNKKIGGILLNSSNADYRENGVHYYTYDYSFVVEGKSYTGRSYGKESDLKTGATVNIEYDENDVTISRIEGMQMQLFSPNLFKLVFIVLLVIGFLIAMGSLREAHNLLLLIRHGVFTTAFIREVKVVKKRNYKPFHIKLDYQTQEGETQEVTLHISDVVEMAVDDEHTILYLPWKPKIATFLFLLSKEEKTIVKK